MDPMDLKGRPHGMEIFEKLWGNKPTGGKLGDSPKKHG